MTAHEKGIVAWKFPNPLIVQRSATMNGAADSRTCIAAWLAGLALATLACSKTTSGARQQLPSTPTVSAAPRPAFSAGDLLVTPPHVYGDPTVRFPDELWPLADAVATVLARPEAGGYRPLPIAQLRALWRDVHAGRLPGVRFVCDAQPPPARLAAYLHRGASSADVRVDCPAPEGAASAGAPCQLEVQIRAPRRSADDALQTDDVARFVATLPPGERPEQWAARVHATGLTRAPRPEPAGGLDLIGSDDGSRRPQISVRDVSQSGGWQAPISKATFANHHNAIVACAAAVARQPSRDWWMQHYIIELDAAGALRRCEFEHVDHLPPPEFGCVCGVLRQIPFGAGPDGRRARFDLQVLLAPPAGTPRDRLSRTFMLTDRRSSDPSALLGSGEIDEVSRYSCLWRVTAPLAETTVPVRFTVGADGRTLRHEAPWPATLTPELAGCLDGVLAGARFNCPLNGAAIVDARLSLAVRAR
jgi:hypothetical protein